MATEKKDRPWDGSQDRLMISIEKSLIEYLNLKLYMKNLWKVTSKRRKN